MEWILTNENVLINLEKVSYICLHESMINFVFEPDRDCEVENELFDSQDEAEKTFHDYISRTVGMLTVSGNERPMAATRFPKIT